MKLKPAPAVAAVAASLIAKHHAALMGVEVVYLFCDKPLTEHGRPAVATHNRAMGRELFWMQTATAQTYFEGAKTGNGLLPDSAEDKQAEEDGFDDPRGMFVVTVWENGWDSLDGDLQRAVIDHELCFPADTLVTGPHTEAGVRRRYSGKLISIETASGKKLTGTPNHPILTPRGWVRLADLNTLDDVVSCIDQQGVSRAMDPHEYQVEARIEDVASPLAMRLGLMPEATQNLHPDSADNNVNVVDADGLLLQWLVSSLNKPLTESVLSLRNRVLSSFASLSHLFLRRDCVLLALPAGVGFPSDKITLFGVDEPSSLGFGVVSKSHTKPRKGLGDRTAVYAQFLSELFSRCPGNVSFDRIVRIGEHKSGGTHVFNLETSQHWYCANSIVTHNCHLGLDSTKEGYRRVLRPHDVEEFQVIIDRHGPYTEALKKALKVAATGQPELEVEEGGADKPKKKAGGG